MTRPAPTNSNRWTLDETNMLLNLWSEEHIQDMLDGTVRDAEVYKKLSALLLNAGFHRNPAQVKNRLKIFKKTYRAVKDKIHTTGNGGKIYFQYFEKIDTVLENRAATAPVDVLESDIPGFCNTGAVAAEEDFSGTDLETSVNEELELFQSQNAGEHVPPPSSPTTQPPLAATGVTTSPATQPGPSHSRAKRPKKSLREALPAAMEKSIQKFLDYQKTVDDELLSLEREHLAVARESLNVKKETLELFKNMFCTTNEK